MVLADGLDPDTCFWALVDHLFYVLTEYPLYSNISCLAFILRGIVPLSQV